MITGSVVEVRRDEKDSGKSLLIIQVSKEDLMVQQENILYKKITIQREIPC